MSGSVVINGVIAPGINGVGALSTGSNSWNSGGNYVCEINGTNVTASDEVVINGSLNVQATSGNPFTIKLVSLTGDNMPGPMPTFNKFASYSWTIATSAGGVQNFATNECVLDASSFSNDFSGGIFSLISDGSSLLVHYTPPVLVPPTWDSYRSWSGDSLFRWSSVGPTDKPMRF